LLSPRQPQSNTVTRIHPHGKKSIALCLALSISLFVFAYAAGEAGAKEVSPKEVLPIAQQCSDPPGAPPSTAICPPKVQPSAIDTPTPLTPPVHTPSVGTRAHEMPSAGPLLPPTDLMPPPGPDRGPKQTPSQSPDTDIVGLGPKPPARPHQGPSPEVASPSSRPSDRHSPTTLPAYQPGTKDAPEEALPLPRLGADPGGSAIEVSVAPGSAKEPKPAAPSLPYKYRPAGAQQPSSPGIVLSAPDRPASDRIASDRIASDKAASDKAASDKVAASPSTTPGQIRKPVPSVTHHAKYHQGPSQAEKPVAAQSEEVRQVAVPVVQHAPLPGFAAEAHVAVHETLTQTIKAVSETVTEDVMGLVESWTPDWLPLGEPTQSALEGTALDLLAPLFPTMPPVDDSSFFSLPGSWQVGAGGGLGVLLLGVIATVLILLRRDGPLFWISGEPPKPTSVLLMPLERPG
jgi:hypothetical protein